MSFQWYAKKADEVFTDWLYSGWSKEKLDLYTGLNAIPGIREYMNYKLDLRRDEEYMNRYGMTYEDIHDPRKLAQVNSGTGALNWVSHNVERLYK